MNKKQNPLIEAVVGNCAVIPAWQDHILCSLMGLVTTKKLHGLLRILHVATIILSVNYRCTHAYKNSHATGIWKLTKENHWAHMFRHRNVQRLPGDSIIKL